MPQIYRMALIGVFMYISSQTVLTIRPSIPGKLGWSKR